MTVKKSHEPRRLFAGVIEENRHFSQEFTTLSRKCGLVWRKCRVFSVRLRPGLGRGARGSPGAARGRPGRVRVPQGAGFSVRLPGGAPARADPAPAPPGDPGWAGAPGTRSGPPEGRVFGPGPRRGAGPCRPSTGTAWRPGLGRGARGSPGAARDAFRAPRRPFFRNGYHVGGRRTLATQPRHCLTQTGCPLPTASRQSRFAWATGRRVRSHEWGGRRGEAPASSLSPPQPSFLCHLGFRRSLPCLGHLPPSLSTGERSTCAAGVTARLHVVLLTTCTRTARRLPFACSRGPP